MSLLTLFILNFLFLALFSLFHFILLLLKNLVKRKTPFLRFFDFGLFLLICHSCLPRVFTPKKFCFSSLWDNVNTFFFQRKKEKQNLINFNKIEGYQNELYFSFSFTKIFENKAKQLSKKEK